MTAQPAKNDKLKSNSVQIEAFGQGSAYSLKYERVLINNTRFKTTASAGGAIYITNELRGVRQAIVVEVTELISFEQHHIEAGVGHSLWNTEHAAEDIRNGGWHPYLTGRVGYRYQKPAGKLLYRIGFMPFFWYKSSLKYDTPWLALNFGYCF